MTVSTYRSYFIGILFIALILWASVNPSYEPFSLPGGACVSDDGSGFGRWDKEKQKCIFLHGKKSKTGIYFPCGTKDVPIQKTIKCTTPFTPSSSKKSSPSSDDNSNIPISDSISNLIHVLSSNGQQNIPINSLPITRCLSKNTDFEQECRNLYGINYGYMNKFNCPNGKIATCSQTYRDGQPRYYPFTTNCRPYKWGNDGGDPQKLQKIKNDCKYLFGKSATLGDLLNLGCTSPDQAMGVCKY